MEKSKVYFTTMKTSFSENLPQKLERLIKTAGIGNIDFTDKYAAIKMHFGEPGNLAFLRPNYAAVVVKVIKELGGNRSLRTAIRCMWEEGKMPWIILTRHTRMAFLPFPQAVM